MKKVQNSLNYDPADWPGEKNTMPSLTIPDQAMSIQEILRRFAQGLPLGGQKVPLYDEELPFDSQQFQKMDLADKAEIMEANKRRLQDLQSELHDQRKDALRSKQSAPAAPGSPNESQQDAPPQYPKKTRGCGASSPTTKQRHSSPLALITLDILVLIDTKCHNGAIKPPKKAGYRRHTDGAKRRTQGAGNWPKWAVVGSTPYH